MTESTEVANAQHSRATRLLRVGVGVLAVLAISTATARTVNTLYTMRAANVSSPSVTTYDSLAAALTLKIARLEPGDPGYTAADARLASFSEKYTQHPWFTLGHMVPAIVMMLLVPLQFSREFRRRHLRIHRWTGRVLLVMLLSVAVSAFYLGVVDDSVPPLERPTIALFTMIFIGTGARAYIAIRRRDVARHREWMIRMFSLALGIVTVRLVGGPFAYLMRSYDNMLVTSFWVGWFINFAVAEWWIRRTRRRLTEPVDASMPVTSLAEVMSA